MSDPVLEIATQHAVVDNNAFVEFVLKYAGVLSPTPHDRIVRAVSEEIADLVRRARAALEALGPLAGSDSNTREALDTLGSEEAFPRARLDGIAERVRATDGPPALADEIDAWTARHRALEQRLQWMLNGTPRRALRAPRSCPPPGTDGCTFSSQAQRDSSEARSWRGCSTAARG